ncbi:hypothetical protein BO71DRAFT_189810 [Aspergillus ellipticus CBS 707.79]|uniref:Uncharacterized protein n=1 Tax=Aspergillus ellipticus CBS 707.79 TaxID=1448320 RepID=A0A319DFA7_9EURO|nr:hypothetical protein BO71DRAFT_189810 [Aspergillus ellipticus CBS 707.79]
MGKDDRPVCLARFAPRACTDLLSFPSERNPCMRAGSSCKSRASDAPGIRASKPSGLTWKEGMSTGRAGSRWQTQNHGSASGRGGLPSGPKYGRLGPLVPALLGLGAVPTAWIVQTTPGGETMKTRGSSGGPGPLVPSSTTRRLAPSAICTSAINSALLLYPTFRSYCPCYSTPYPMYDAN